jgi:glycosyltransferase involved in cell wall biosynthesis
MNSPKLSVIICTYNRSNYILDALHSLVQQTLSHNLFEVLLINNNSTDATESLCKNFAQHIPDFNYRYMVETQQGLSHARNCGIKEASGDILIYVDDDATVNAEYLQAYYSFFEQYPLAMAAGGPVIPVYETKKPRWLSHFTIPLITGYFYKGKKIKAFKKSGFPRGGNAAYRKAVFDKTGYFNVQLGRKGDSLIGAEEKDIFDKMRALRMPFYYLPGAILYHIIPASKLTDAYFNTLTVSLGKSEQLRTRAISKWKYVKRLIIEAAKWGVAIGLCVGYSFLCAPQKGWKLLRFRWNVTKGLF